MVLFSLLINHTSLILPANASNTLFEHVIQDFSMLILIRRIFFLKKRVLLSSLYVPTLCQVTPCRQLVPVDVG